MLQWYTRILNNMLRHAQPCLHLHMHTHMHKHMHMMHSHFPGEHRQCCHTQASTYVLSQLHDTLVLLESHPGGVIWGLGFRLSVS